MFRFLRRLFFTLAMLGGLLIVLFWTLNQLKTRAPSPVSSVAAKLESLMQP